MSTSWREDRHRCGARGSQALLGELVGRLAGHDDVVVERYWCFNGCGHGPNVVLARDRTWYEGVGPGYLEVRVKDLSAATRYYTQVVGLQQTDRVHGKAYLKAWDERSTIDAGPTRHGSTRGHTIYFFDPSGNRNEVFTGGYWADPKLEPVTWTADKLWQGIFYWDRVEKGAFVANYT
jgi:(2Fe-2S) ferredoxin